MAKPWEKYSGAEESGPWSKYSPEPKSQAGFRDKDEAWYTELARGVGLSAAKTGLGIADLVGMDIDPMHEKALELWEKDIEEGSAWGDTGEVVGDIAQFAAPGAAAYKGAKALGAGWKGIAGAEALTGGLLGGAKIPVGDETRLSNAGTDAALSAVGSGAFRGAGKFVDGMKKSDAGKKLMELVPDYKFSPATLLDSDFVKNTQHFLENTPITSRRATKAAKRDKEMWNLASLRDIAENPSKVTSAGPDGFKVVDEQINKAYNKAWGKVGEMPSSLAITLRDQVDEIVKKKPFLRDSTISTTGTKEINALDSVLDRADDLYLEATPKGMQAFDSHVREIIKKTDPVEHYDLREVLKEVKKTTRDAMPTKARKKLKSLDGKFPNLLALGDATESAGGRLADIFEPSDYMSGVRRRASGRDFARGEGPGRELADAGARAFKGAEIESQAPLLSPLWRIARGMPGSAALPFGTASNLMTGQTAFQKLLKRAGVDKDGARGQVYSPALMASLFGDD